MAYIQGGIQDLAECLLLFHLLVDYSAMNFKRVLLGDPKDADNVFCFDRVVENLPGTKEYNPLLPWVYKVPADGRIAADVHIYVDNGRLTAPD